MLNLTAGFFSLPLPAFAYTVGIVVDDSVTEARRT